MVDVKCREVTVNSLCLRVSLLRVLCKCLITSLKISFVLLLIILGCWWATSALMKKNELNDPENSNHSITNNTTSDNVTPLNVTSNNLTEIVTVTVYYETDCPDCQNFITSQLYPTHKHPSLQEKLVVDFVPFGKAKQYILNGKPQFACQHGPTECMGNMLHACAINVAYGGKQPQDCPWDQRVKLMEFIYCNEDRDDHIKSVEECAKKAGLDGDEIVKCANSALGPQLLSDYGKRTSAYRPAVGWNTGFVPSVAIDEVHNEMAVSGLLDEICRLRREFCSVTSST